MAENKKSFLLYCDLIHTVEQLTDDFFQSDYVLFYEDLHFTSVQYQKNQYSFEIEKIFSNLDYVEHRLANWNYSAVYHGKK